MPPTNSASNISVGSYILLEQLRHDADEDYAISNLVFPAIKKGRMASNYSRNRRLRQRRSWSNFQRLLTDRQFRRYFRMSREVFASLCEKIEEMAGQDTFKSEEYLDDIINSPSSPLSKNIILAHQRSTGGFICGEIRLAVTLRVLGGGSYMDMALLFDTSFHHVYKIVREVIENWLLHDLFCPINGVEYCSNNDRMNDVAMQFSEASGGVINGCIGALDGWVVKIQKPMKSDGVNNPQSFYSRKGYYAVNVQAIADKKKRILFRSILSRGAEHDSTAFKNSSLYKWLILNWEELSQKGYFFIGDTAYSLKSFLMTPYDGTMHGTAEDNFNYFHSSSRISIECAFGEINLRWGILWCALKFSLKMNCMIIDACMRLHNFIVDSRNDESFGTSLDREVFDDDCRRFFAINAFVDDDGVRGGEDDVRRDEEGNTVRGGRSSRVEAQSTMLGKRWRDMHRDEITRQRLVRPRSNWYRVNNRTFE